MPTYSVWLEVPALQPVVSELAAEAGNPPFLPHLTLAGGLTRIDPQAALSALGGMSTGLTLRLSGFGTKHEPDRFFCLVADRTPQLDEVFAQVAAIVGESPVASFRQWPHVSLVYGTPGAAARWPDPMVLAERLGDTLYGDYRPAAVGVWRTSGDVAGWERTP